MGMLGWRSCAGVMLVLVSAAGPGIAGPGVAGPGVAGPGAVGAGRQPPAEVSGRQLYRTHCATCHGPSGRGDGPMVQYLRVPPADLTTIAAGNNGVFPAEAVHRAIDGRRAVRAHGESAMPIWGDAFSPTERAATERIRALVVYLESIQARAGDE